MAATVSPQSTTPTHTGRIKPISGSWFEFQHHATVEGIDWNPACACFSCAQWDTKIKEMADVGIKTLVLMCTALYYRAFYRTSIFPQWKLSCPDPLEAVLAAADKYGVRFFIGGGFYGEWDSPKIVSDPLAAKRRLQAIEELTRLYGHHPSFYGWYWPNEAFINPYYSDEFIHYVNECSKLARQLMPRTRILIAPYGTRVVKPDDTYVKQLGSLDVDFIAYQDEIGVRKSKATETSAFYEGLKKAHDRVARIGLWADVEIFEFEGDLYHSALVPASFSRVLSQLEAVSPWVDEILIYQYLGLMNKPGSTAFAGPADSAKLYQDYISWIRSERGVGPG
ncbi:MAG TPA: DUF4434 domain-containing protein [Bryobacteraceae bacterium]|nr:DUF4434 domain-containing protein [Bryobacteraceae bacterium]